MDEDPSGGDPVAEAAPGMPRWVKALAIVAVGLVLAFVILHLAGVGPTGHGP